MAWALAQLACLSEDLGHRAAGLTSDPALKRQSALSLGSGVQVVNSIIVRAQGVAGPSPSCSFRVSSAPSDLEVAQIKELTSWWLPNLQGSTSFWLL